ncbi:MAG: Hsp20/alpha crystallin family protein [Treponema sp.]|nr:Hsp20/alpha crystallin family protein [Treponema sp.]
MKGNRMYVDIGSMLDEIFDAAKNFGEEMQDKFGPGGAPRGPWFHGPDFDENTDWYPNFSYPPMNIYLTPDRTLVFEFAVAGFDEKDISLSFQGDYMLFSARIGLESAPEDGVRFIKRRLKLKDIEKQKYYVPADKFAQEKVKAVFKNGILRVTVPPKEEMETAEGIKIEIVKEPDSN